MLGCHKGTVAKHWRDWKLPGFIDEQGRRWFSKSGIEDWLDGPDPRLRPTKSWILPEDGIVDELAIRLAMSGERRIALTERERKIAVERMAKQGATSSEIIKALRAGPHWVRVTLNELGYDLVGTSSTGMYVVPKDRPRKPPEKFDEFASPLAHPHVRLWR